MTIRKREALATMPPNTTRLVHLNRPQATQSPCDACGVSITGGAHWRVRTYLLEPAPGEKKDRPVHMISHACSLGCGRQLYEAARIEITLMSGKRTVVKLKAGESEQAQAQEEGASSWSPAKNDV